MLLRRTVLFALIVGLIMGLVYTGMQVFTLNPIIFEAETYEVLEPSAQASSHDPLNAQQHEHHQHGDHASAGHHGEGHHGGGHHDGEEWTPEDGAERTLYTVIANVSIGIGFAAILLALMSQFQIQGLTRINALKGLAWGAGGFVAFFLAPSLGVPPEIPGIDTSQLEPRQGWWLLAVACVGVGLLVLVFAPVKFKVLGVVSMVLPYVIGAPHPEGGAVFNHPDPAAVATLSELHEHFILTTGVVNLVYWLVLGVLCAWVLNRWILQGALSTASAK